MRKKSFIYLLLFAFLVVASVIFYRDTISLFPSFIHAWTQSDRYALSLAFLDNGMNLFKPQTFNLMTVDGITGVDLPWHEYIVAIFMKISGSESPLVFRLYTLLYSFVGYFFLFRLVKLFTPSSLKALVVVGFTFTLPVLVYYQAGFVPSAPALSTLFIGYYYYYRSRENDSRLAFYLALLLLTAAALYRAPYNIFLFAVLIQQVIKAVRLKRVDWPKWLGFAIAYSMIIGYHFYKSYLKAKYGSMFLTEVMPAQSWQEFNDIIGSVKQNWLWAYFTIPHYIMLLLSTVALLIFLIRKKSCDRLRVILSQQVMLTLAGAFVYFLLMARQFPDHDYYIIDSFYPGIVLLLLLGVLSISYSKGWQKWAVGTIFTMLVLASVAMSKKVQEDRYTFHFWDRGEITRKNFEGSGRFLDSLEIPPSAKVLVLDAYSTNTPLILMDRRGYTVQNTTRENLDRGLSYPFDYVVIQDVFLPSDVIYNYPELAQHLKRIGGNGKISVFEYSPDKGDGNLNNLLGIPQNTTSHRLRFDSIEKHDHWKFDIDTVSAEGTAGTIGFMKSEHLFGPTYVLNHNPKKDKLMFSARFKPATSEVRFEVVASVMQQGQQLYYQSFPVHLRSDGWKAYNCLFDLPGNLPNEVELKCNIYNPGGAEVYMDSLSVTLY